MNRISKYRASCLAVLERVPRTRKPILATRFGKPVAQISPPPPPPPQRSASWLGSLAGECRNTGDIISPAADESDWEVLND